MGFQVFWCGSGLAYANSGGLLGGRAAFFVALAVADRGDISLGRSASGCICDLTEDGDVEHYPMPRRPTLPLAKRAGTDFKSSRELCDLLNFLH